MILHNLTNDNNNVTNQQTITRSTNDNNDKVTKGTPVCRRPGTRVRVCAYVDTCVYTHITCVHIYTYIHIYI